MVGVGRTPPRNNDNPNATIEFPKQRLGAVTRVQNNITELLPKLTENRAEIEGLLTKLEIKMAVFKEMCEEELLKTAPVAEKENLEK